MYRPFDIGQSFRIVPPGTAPAPGRIDLITARGAFGSGEHETTVSCLELLEGLPDLSGTRVLDLGSGTGILAIAAVKLGAESALCVDISSRAVATCRTNCDLNDVSDKVRHLEGSLDDVAESGFDLVLANIYGDLLVNFAPGLARRLRPEGRLILSGILWEDNYAVREACRRAGCRLEANRMLEEYSSLLLRRG